MITWLLLILTIYLAALSVQLVYRAGSLAWRYSWHRYAVAVLLAFFVYRYGMWIYASLYLRTAFRLCFAVFLLLGLSRKKIAANDYPAWKRITNYIVIPLLLLLNVTYYTGTVIPKGKINLSLPFRGGKYIVFQGGRGLPANIFHVASRNAVFAMDIVKVNSAGNRANAVFTKDLHSYAIFSDTIVSPCSGRVLRVVSDNPDNIPPERKRGLHNLNSVTIETDSAYVFLGHLKENSVFVKAGDVVQAGMPLGLAGNSGMSLEPHLHIQAHRREGNKPWYQCMPLLMIFNGEEYRLNEVIE